MKNFKLTKRRVAGLAVVLAIASIGIFTGTYAKYVSTLDLDDNATDQDAQVAVWHVGEPVSIGNLFSPYYYADSYHSGESDLGNSGHSSYFKTSGSKSGDTVFNNPTDTADPENLIAPGTRGEKSFRIQDNVKSDGSTPVGSGATEVSYTVKFPALDSAGSRVTFDGSSAEYLKTQLKFKLFINNIPQTSGWVTATVLDTALSNVTLYYDSDGLDDEVTIEWEWPFDDTDGSGTYDSSDVAAAAAQTTVAVNFGTVRYEQVDASVPFNRNGVTRFDNAKWLILEDDTTNHKAKIIRTTPLTYEEAGVTQPVAGGDGDDATGTGTDASAMLTFLPASNEYLTYFDSDGNNNYGKTGDGGFAISPVRKAVENYYANMTNTADKARVLAIKQDCPSFSDFSDGLSSEQGFKVRTGDDSVTPTNWERSLKFSSLDARYKTVLATNGGTLTAFVPTLGDIVASSLEIEDTGKGYYLLGATTLNTWLASPGKQDDNVAALAGMNGRVVIFSEVPLVNDSSFFPFSVHPALWISY